jgi:hypothetical protein
MRGPLPSCRPEFPSTFLEQAEKRARQRTVPYQVRQRATLVLLLHQQALVSTIEAAERVQVHLRSVQRWRMLDTDAIKPWRYKYWIVRRDPHFVEKAGPMLDLYAGMWPGQALGPKDHIRSADEKTSIQARRRCHPSVSSALGRPSRIEHEYEQVGSAPPSTDLVRRAL